MVMQNVLWLHGYMLPLTVSEWITLLTAVKQGEATQSDLLRPVYNSIRPMNTVAPSLLLKRLATDNVMIQLRNRVKKEVN